MKILVLGATGATGRLVVKQLLDHGHSVIALVRSLDRLPSALLNEPGFEVVEGNLLQMSSAEILKVLKECRGVVSCLGHSLSLEGIYGSPRMLVRDSMEMVCNTIIKQDPGAKVKIVLMNTAGNSNRDLAEPVSSTQRVVVGLIRILVPPHGDNEQAADYLRVEVGQDHPLIDWVAVRPDSLIDEEEVTEYELHPRPTRSAIFNPGKTSRINVAHFMTNLISDEAEWNRWKGQMPVIYNKEL